MSAPTREAAISRHHPLIAFKGAPPLVRVSPRARKIGLILKRPPEAAAFLCSFCANRSHPTCTPL
jgi:hypothetical protein